MIGIKKQPKNPVSTAEAQKIAEEAQVSEAYNKGITALRDFIAPSSIEFNYAYFRIGLGWQELTMFTAILDKSTLVG